MTLLIRADANSGIGTGHVMRCLALAQEWILRGGTVSLVAAALPSALKRRITAEGLSVSMLDTDPGCPADAGATADAAVSQRADWIVLDGYQFGTEYQRELSEALASLSALPPRILVIDDTAQLPAYLGHLLLNQNVYAVPSLYNQSAPATRCLCGSRYAMLRREFVRTSPIEAVPDVARRILVTFGGADPRRMTPRALKAVCGVNVPGLTVDVVVGAGGESVSAIQVPRASVATIRLHRHVCDMAGLMREADLCLTAAGSTCWELAYLGIPMLVVATAENQRPIASGLAAQGAATNLGWYEGLTTRELAGALEHACYDTQGRSLANTRMRILVDGSGAWRVVEAMHDVPRI